MLEEKYSEPINNGLDMFTTLTWSRYSCKSEVFPDKLEELEIELGTLTLTFNDFHDLPPEPVEPDKSSNNEEQLPITRGPEI